MPAIDPHSQLTDEELLVRYRHRGDNQWLGLLLARYTMLLLGVAMKYLKDRQQAQDAVQQIFLKALTHLPQGEIQNFKGWLYILMRNHCLQQLREKTYLAGEEALAYTPADDTEGKAVHLQQEYTLAQMHTALRELDANQRQAVELFYLHKQSYQQIMAHTGWSFMQVKSYIQNGKRNLRTILLTKLGTQP